jgi:hypothetical protein
MYDFSSHRLSVAIANDAPDQGCGMGTRGVFDLLSGSNFHRSSEDC